MPNTATALAQTARQFDLQELARWVVRYADYYQHGYDMPHCWQWARYHYDIYLEDGSLPDFMR